MASIGLSNTVGIFDEFVARHTLANTWTERIKSIEAARLQPYADLLVEKVWEEILVEKENILAALLEKCKTATHQSQLEVPIWSFNHVFGMHKLSYLSKLLAKNRGWHYTMHTEDTMYKHMLYYPTSLHHIVKLTDFLDQLALRFGHNFRVRLLENNIMVDEHEQKFTRTVVTLMLQYFPKGLTKYQAKKQEEFRIKSLNTTREKLNPEEVCVIWKGYKPEDPLYNPLRHFVTKEEEDDYFYGYDSE